MNLDGVIFMDTVSNWYVGTEGTARDLRNRKEQWTLWLGQVRSATA